MTHCTHPAAPALAAAHRTALLLERCRNGLPAAAAAPASAQSLWHGYQQTLFLAWLDAGGFAQSDAGIENSGMAPLFSVPQGDLNEEFKFSLSRIDDAVE
jgi:hypothetical protein